MPLEALPVDVPVSRVDVWDTQDALKLPLTLFAKADHLSLILKLLLGNPFLLGRL